MSNTIAGIRIPDSALARATTEYIRDVESDLLYNHSRRVFLFGALSGERQGVRSPDAASRSSDDHDPSVAQTHY